MKCVFCKGSVSQTKAPVIMLGKNLGEFNVGVCQKCGEQYYSEKVSEQIEVASKKAGIWGLNSKTRVGQSGNALMIRISKRLAEFLKLKKGQEVQIEPKNSGEFVVKLVG